MSQIRRGAMPIGKALKGVMRSQVTCPRINFRPSNFRTKEGKSGRPRRTRATRKWDSSWRKQTGNLIRYQI